TKSTSADQTQAQAADSTKPTKEEKPTAQADASSKPATDTQAPAQTTAQTTRPKAAALVDGTAIPYTEFEMEINRLEQEYMEKNLRQPEPEKLKEMKKGAMDHLIGRELLYLDSKNKGMKIDDAELDGKLKALQAQFSSPEEYQQALAQMNMTDQDLKENFRRALTVEQWITKEFVDKVSIADQDVQNYYDKHPEYFKKPETVRVSHILISAGAQAKEEDKKEARKKIDDIKKRLDAGEDFAALAKELSQCPSKEKGGDLGFISRGQTVKPFEEAAFKLAPNQISDVVETTFGYHVIKSVDRQPAGVTPLADVKAQIKEFLKNEQAGQKLNAYVAGLREKAKIEVLVLDK
ncbi:MAG: peptidylprolyl isomerase, partial [Deltaproteobacteria bacterium]|nr:peptidylprolyl isomerase [Deltaproteobacteria bacterium]